MALIPTAVSEPFLYLFEVKNAIFCKFLYLGFRYSRNYTCTLPKKGEAYSSVS